MTSDLVQKSKNLAHLLRHKPERVGLVLDPNGYALVIDLMKKAGFTETELESIVSQDEKGRYEFDEAHTKIRAVQGHSLKNVDAMLKEAVPPIVLYHGTKDAVVHTIMKKGLQPMNRQHVHLTDDKFTARNTADRRKGESVILKVDSKRMYGDGISFYQASNAVWLIEFVDPKYITVAED